MNATALAALIGTMPGYTAETVAAEVRAWLRQSITVVLPVRLITARTVLAEYPGGPAAAAAVLDKLEALAVSISPVKWAMRFLTTEGGLDIASPATRAQLDALATGGALTSEEAEHLKALGEQTVSRWGSIGGSDADDDAVIDAAVAGVRGWI